MAVEARQSGAGSGRGRGVRRSGPLVLVALAAALLLGAAGWVVSDRLEQRNDFCQACHLPDGTPLHQALRRDFDARPPVDLASAHAAAALAAGDPAFRCFDCHSGTGAVGRARVKLLATKDAFWYVTGRFAEPTRMRVPLRDADCTKCHASFPESEARAAGAEGWSRPFHAIAVHNAGLDRSCVGCHLAHDRGGVPQAYFLSPARLREACAECHNEFALQ